MAPSLGRPGLALAPQPAAACSSVVGLVSRDLADPYDTLAQRKWLGGKSLDCRTRTRSPREDPGISRLRSDAPSRDSTGGQQTSSAHRASSPLRVFKFCIECVALHGGALIGGSRVVPISQGAYVTGQVFSLLFFCLPSFCGASGQTGSVRPLQRRRSRDTWRPR